MKQGRFEKKMAARKSSKKLAVLLLALALLIGGTIGGTLAYLKDVTTPVTNTFVVGDIGKLDLTEDGANNNAQDFIIIPGVDIEKNPVVTFDGTNNIDAYVFVKVVPAKGNATNAYAWSYDATTNKYNLGTDEKLMTWTVAAGWNKLDNVDNVFYRTVEAEDTVTDATWPIMAAIGNTKDTIEVSENIEQSDIGKYASSLTFTAYAIQKDGFTDAKDAWTKGFPTN